MISQEVIDAFGYTAGFLLVASLIPQIIKMIQLKSGEEISIWFLIIQLVVSALFVAYGILLNQMPLYIPNAILIAEEIVIIIIKYVYHWKKANATNPQTDKDPGAQDNIEIEVITQ